MKNNFWVLLKMNVVLVFEKKEKIFDLGICTYCTYNMQFLYKASIFQWNLTWASNDDSPRDRCIQDSAWKGREDVWSLWSRGGEKTEPRWEAWDHPLLAEVLPVEGPDSGGALGALAQRRGQKETKEYGSGVEENIFWRLGWMVEFLALKNVSNL